jgi:serine/threonine protein kinase
MYNRFLSDYAIDLLDRLLAVDPKERLTCEGAREHEFYLGLAESMSKGGNEGVWGAFVAAKESTDKGGS